VHQRIGIPKHLVEEYIETVQQFGKSTDQLNGKLRRYVEAKYQEYDYKYEGEQYAIVYANYIFWFIEDILITAVDIQHDNRLKYRF
jgi:hypothetical protein